MDKKIKKQINILIIILIIALLAFFIYHFVHRYNNRRNIEFKAAEGMFKIYEDDKWNDFLIKGVNLGLGKPGHFPGEVQITKDEYKRWFKQISQMNANTIRVYTIQAPVFYEALFEYNLSSKSPLYLFHGVWINEELVLKYNNAYAEELNDDYKNEIINLVNILHGKAEIPQIRGHAYGSYIWDISPYIAGYILGIELDSDFVIGTNDANPDKTYFEGRYLTTVNASPHECWLARTGDFLIAYEMDKYNVQKPVSWVNWLTTDPIWHSNEPDPEREDAVSVDTEHIIAKEAFYAGLFASYHVYPYYPEFMVFQPEYINYIDKKGKRNSYLAYLLDLKAHHNVPLLIAEFGLPSSRGCTHINNISGYNQGNLTEEEQGNYTADMFENIVEADCAGGMIFTWQDEWFKRSWNTMDNDIPEKRPFWSNYQVSEQYYGVLSFDPGIYETISQTDGNINEWGGKKAVCGALRSELYMMSDEKYIYFLLKDSNKNIENNKYIIGIDSVPDQGNNFYGEFGINFTNAAESVIIINGRENSSFKIDAYYDLCYRFYSIINVIDKIPEYEKKNSGIFNPVNLMLSNRLFLPLTNESISPRFYETGKLRYGNSNPLSNEFDSLADFCFSGDEAAELRIPWALLNVADPSAKTVAGDLYANNYFNLNPVVVDNFNIELAVMDGNSFVSGDPGVFNWKPWENVTYHERLKKSYYIIRDCFGKY